MPKRIVMHNVKWLHQSITVRVQQTSELFLFAEDSTRKGERAHSRELYLRVSGRQIHILYDEGSASGPSGPGAKPSAREKMARTLGL